MMATSVPEPDDGVDGLLTLENHHGLDPPVVVMVPVEKGRAE